MVERKTWPGASSLAFDAGHWLDAEGHSAPHRCDGLGTSPAIHSRRIPAIPAFVYPSGRMKKIHLIADFKIRHIFKFGQRYKSVRLKSDIQNHVAVVDTYDLSFYYFAVAYGGNGARVELHQVFAVGRSVSFTETVTLESFPIETLQ